MLNIEYLNVLKEIDSLFNNRLYYKNKEINESENIIKMLFKKQDNCEDLYSVIIKPNNFIEVTVPIKNSNYKYKTKMYGIEDVYNYLYLHTKN